MTAAAVFDTAAVPDPSTFAVELRRWLADHADDLAGFREPVADLDSEAVELSFRPFQNLLYDAGWSRWGWPEMAGGRGGPAVLRGVLYDELARAGYRFPDALYPLETLGPMMVQFAPALAADLMAPLLRGDELWCQGFSEPDAGSDLASLRCTATAIDEGWLVSGQKIWVSFGHVSNRCALLARTVGAEERHHSFSMLLVDLDLPGATVLPIRAASGRHDFAQLFFDDVVVPADRVIGEVGQGWAIAMYLLQWERGMYAWQRQALLHSELTSALAERRHPPGAALAERIGGAYRAVHALRLSSRRTLERLSAGENPGPEISVDKILLSTAEQCVYDVVRELWSPRLELDAAVPVDLLRADYFYSRSASIYGGSAEIQRTILADRVLGLPKEGL